MNKFENLGLAEPILRAVRAEGYETPTPIQAQAIAHVLAGRDLMGCAQTGTGKTAAFALPTLHRLGQVECRVNGRGRKIRALVLSPTRELASQIGASFRTGLYGVFSPGPEDWKLEFLRGGFIVGDVEVRRGTLTEEIPTYGVDDALCCPSGTRRNRITHQEGEFEVRFAGVSGDRGLAISERNGVTEIGPLDIRYASPSQATAAFGSPTSAYSDDFDQSAAPSVSCEFSWADLGLHISFVHLGGSDACVDGLVQSFRIEGLAGEQAGWQTADGVRVGMTQRQLAKLYPSAEDASPSGKVDLIQRYTNIAGGGYQDLLTAKLRDGEVIELSSFVGAAGE